MILGFVGILEQTFEKVGHLASEGKLGCLITISFPEIQCLKTDRRHLFRHELLYLELLRQYFGLS